MSLVTVAILSLSAPTPSGVLPPHPEDSRRVAAERIGGADRFAVSAAVSAAVFAPGAPVAYVASGEGFADAVAASATAGGQNGPVLLVRKGEIPADVRAELLRLKPSRIVVVGGVDAVSAAVEAQLRSLAPLVERAADADRYGTAVQMSQSFPRVVPGTPDPSVFVATGENFPDALAASALAGFVDAPVLLASGAGISPATLAETRRLRPEKIFVLGGSDVVPDQVVGQLELIAPTYRMAGRDRYETATSVSDTFRGPGRTVYIASGETFPDALSGGAAASQSGSPLLLVTSTAIPSVIADDLRRLRPSRIVVLGGTEAVSAQVADELAQFITP